MFAQFSGAGASFLRFHLAGSQGTNCTAMVDAAYVGLGDNEQAFAWLERAYQKQSNILQFLKVHPYFDPLRDDPRFADLPGRVGLN